jgi:hypothetical protein
VEASQFPKGDYRAPVPVIQPGLSYRSVTDKLTMLVLTPNTPLAWFGIMGVAFTLLTGLLVSLAYLLLKDGHTVGEVVESGGMPLLGSGEAR